MMTEERVMTGKSINVRSTMSSAHLLQIGPVIGHELTSGGDLKHIELNCDEQGQVERHLDRVETHCT